MNNVKINLSIEDERWTAAIADIAAVVERVKDAVIDCVGGEVDFLAPDKQFSLNLCLSNDEEVHRLNKEFRGMDKATNVLSFANADDDAFDEMLASDAEVELGDVIVAFETMEREAQELEASFYEHFCHLWTHGMLHILGYDHIEPEERAEMERREIDILEKLKIANPYQE
jgi:probable rRNA maturation factor